MEFKINFDINVVDIFTVLISIVAIIISTVAFHYPYKKKLKIRYAESSKCYLGEENNQKIIINKKVLKVNIANTGNKRIKLKDHEIYYDKNMIDYIYNEGAKHFEKFIEPEASIELIYDLDYIKILLKNSKNLSNKDKKLTLSFIDETGNRHNLKTNIKIKELLQSDKNYLVSKELINEENAIIAQEL